MRRKTSMMLGIAALLVAALACGPAGQPTEEVAVIEDITFTPDPNQAGEVELPDDAPQNDQPVEEPQETEEPAEQEPQEAPPPEYTEWRDELLTAIIDRDYETMQASMGSEFHFGYWNSEGTTNTPAEAIDNLRSNLLPAEGFVYYYLFEDLPSMLGGQDPKQMWGPDANIIDAVRFTDWEPDGKGEAIVVIEQREDGSYIWYGVLYAGQGFAATGSNPPPAQAAVTSTPGPTATPNANKVKQQNLNTFINGLISAIDNREFEVLKGWMDGGLAILGDPTGLYPEDIAAEHLKTTLIPASADLAFGPVGTVNFETGVWNETFTDELGAHIDVCCGNATHVVAGIYVDGWQNTSEAILIIIEVQNNVFKWYGYAEGPF